MYLRPPAPSHLRVLLRPLLRLLGQRVHPRHYRPALDQPRLQLLLRGRRPQQRLLRKVPPVDALRGRRHRTAPVEPSRRHVVRIGHELVARRPLPVLLAPGAVVGDPVHQLVVDDVEAHRGQRHARYYVDGAEPDGGGRTAVDRIEGGHRIAEADRRQAHEAEVEAVEERQTLEPVQGERAQADVREHHRETEEDRGEDAPAPHRARLRVVGAARAVRLLRVEVVGDWADVERLLQTIDIYKCYIETNVCAKYGKIGVLTERA